MGAQNNMTELASKIRDFEARLIDVEKRLSANERAIRANREKAWFAYDRTIDHETRIDQLEEAEERRDD